MRCLVGLMLFAVCALANAGTVTVIWTAPTACSDGSAVSNCAATGYEVYQGTSPTGTAYTLRETVAPTVFSVTYNDIAPGSRCFYLKTVSGLLKSGESTRACVTVPAPAPGVPGGVTVTIVVTVATP